MSSIMLRKYLDLIAQSQKPTTMVAEAATKATTKTVLAKVDTKPTPKKVVPKLPSREKATEGIVDSIKGVFGGKGALEKRHTKVSRYMSTLGVNGEYLQVWKETSEKEKEQLLKNLERCMAEKNDDFAKKLVANRLKKSAGSRAQVATSKKEVEVHDDTKRGAATGVKQRDDAHDASKKYDTKQAAGKKSFNSLNTKDSGL